MAADTSLIASSPDLAHLSRHDHLQLIVDLIEDFREHRGATHAGSLNRALNTLEQVMEDCRELDTMLQRRGMN